MPRHRSTALDTSPLRGPQVSLEHGYIRGGRVGISIGPGATVTSRGTVIRDTADAAVDNYGTFNSTDDQIG